MIKVTRKELKWNDFSCPRGVKACILTVLVCCIGERDLFVSAVSPELEECQRRQRTSVKP